MNEATARTWMYRAVCESAGVPPASQWDEFARCFHLRSLPKGAQWITAGQTTTTVAFVAQGLLRMYYLREDGREFNKTFVYAPDFLGVLDALLTGESSRLSVQSLEPTTLLEVEHARACSFYERHPYWERFGRLFAERLYVKKARREAALLVESPAHRYRTFLDEHASLEQRVPDYHIASYLGITPETLSRLRKALAS